MASTFEFEPIRSEDYESGRLYMNQELQEHLRELQELEEDSDDYTLWHNTQLLNEEHPVESPNSDGEFSPALQPPSYHGASSFHAPDTLTCTEEGVSLQENLCLIIPIQKDDEKSCTFDNDKKLNSENSIEEKIRIMKKKFNCKDLILKSTLGTGTFGRVVLTQHKPSHTYLALKVLEIDQVVKLKQVQHVKNEKKILLTLSHPFIVKMYWSTHTNTHLYMLMEYVCGGELFTYLRNAGFFPNDIALFYACEILLVLEFLHSHQLIYRDLKPENLLLDKHGHLKITDFGFAKKLDDRSWTLCGTPEYLAPEIIQNKGHNKAVDWWALGILIYEMLTGYPPFYDESPTGIYEKILEGSLEFPKHLESSAKDLIKKLLSRDRTRRLGNMKNGPADVKNHRWFKRIEWLDVRNKKLQPPIVPRVRHTGDTRNFFDYPEENCKNQHLVLPLETSPPSSTREHLFDDF